MQPDVIMTVDVGVSLSRPPKVDRIVRVIVSDDLPDDGDLSGLESRMVLTAIQIASSRSDVVMPVSSSVVSMVL